MGWQKKLVSMNQKVIACNRKVVAWLLGDSVASLLVTAASHIV